MDMAWYGVVSRSSDEKTFRIGLHEESTLCPRELEDSQRIVPFNKYNSPRLKA